MLITPETKPWRLIEPRMTEIRRPIVQPIDAIAYTMPNKNMFHVVRLRCTETSGWAIGSFQPNNIAMPITTRPIPIMRAAYFALSRITVVNAREMIPTTRNRPMNPDETAVPTLRPRRNVVVLFSPSRLSSVPR